MSFLPTIVLKVSFSLFMITNLKKLFYIIVSVLLFEVKSFGAPDAGSLLKDQQNLQKLNEIIPHLLIENRILFKDFSLISLNIYNTWIIF